MMVSTFSSFDPVCFDLPLKWVYLPFVVAFMSTLGVKVVPSLASLMKSWGSFLDGMSVLKSWSFFSFLMALFWSLVFMNLQGLLPFSFTVSAHLWLALLLAFCYWLSSVVGQTLDSFKSRISHLVPGGSPVELGSILSLVEVVSMVIRPITLGVRLMANMVSGHILLHLASGLAKASLSGVIMSVVPMVVLEVAVAGIQAYVFVVLFLLYMEEVYLEDLWTYIYKSPYSSSIKMDANS